jgi:hypothetical protein
LRAVRPRTERIIGRPRLPPTVPTRRALADLRKVHVEWCPFKPKAVGPVFFSEIHTNTIKDAAPKLTVSKALLPKPREPADGSAPAFLDRAHVTFADGSERTIDFSEVPTIRDILEELDSENVRIAQEERKRGKPFS